MKILQTTYIKILCFSLLSALFIHSSYAQEGVVDNEVEKAALLAFYNSTNGSEWSSAYQWDLAELDNYPNASLAGIVIENGDVITIDIYQGNLSGSLPAELNNLTELDYISIKYSGLLGGVIPDLSALTKLRIFELRNCYSIEGNFPNWISALSNLESLELSNAGLSGKINETIKNLSVLDNLDLRGNDFSEVGAIPTFFNELDKVVSLNLRDCNLNVNSFSQNALSGLDLLKILDLTGNENLILIREDGTREFPDILNSLPSLSTLWLTKINIEDFGPNFQNLLLETLFMNYNNLSNINAFHEVIESLKYLSNLKKLYLDNCQITDFPFNFSELLGLESLSLGLNQTIDLNNNSELGSLVNLQKLTLSNCNLEELPPYFANFTKLTHLQLSHNKFTNIPSEIDELESLENLSLYVNQISAIPDWFGTGFSKNIQDLDIRFNLLTFPFPQDFYKCNFRYLYLSNNQLEGAIPKDFENFVDLTRIDLSFNEIDDLAIDLKKLIRLQYILLNNNQLSGDFVNFIGDWVPNRQFRVDLTENLFTSIEAFPSHNRSALKLAKNAFTFEDLVIQEPPYGTFTYAPQALVDIEKSNQAMIGEEVTLSAEVDREVEGCIYTWYQKNTDGQNIAIANTADYTITTVTQEDLDKEYFYTITHPDLPSLTLTSYIQTLSEFYCPPNVDIDFFKWDYLCAVKLIPILSALPEGIRIISYNWSFGDGATSVLKAPLHEYSSAGQYNVTLDLVYTFEGCDELNSSITKTITYDPTSSDNVGEVTLNLATQRLSDVLAINASAFSDAWSLLPYNQLSDLNPYESGSKGVWRTSSLHAIKTGRVQSTNVNLKTNGGFTADYFVPQFIDEQMIPNWLKTNSVTQYNSLGNEVENKDILGIYSAELYGYGGHLPIASGVNMGYQEMAVTSFEDLNDLEASNWYITDRQRGYFQSFPVSLSQGHMIYLQVAEGELDGVNVVDVVVSNAFNLTEGNLGSDLLRNVEILCRSYNSETGILTLILSEAPNGFWFGNIQTKRVRQGWTKAIFDEGFGHTGTNSLLVQNEGSSIFKQELLKLEANKNYQFSAWVSINNTALLTPKLGEGIGVELALRNRAGDIVNSVMLAAAGPIVEGWQQINGSILVAESNLLLEVGFKKGDQDQVWFDDLRFHPLNGNLKSFVYDRASYRLKAILDENNFATRYSYDQEGNLYLVKKETTEGIKTISENNMYQINTDNYNE